MKKIVILNIFVAMVFEASCQFSFGIGLQKDVAFSSSTPILLLNDSVFFGTRDTRSIWDSSGDPDLSIYANFVLFENERYSVEASFRYFKRYTNTYVGKEKRFGNGNFIAWHTASIVNGSFLFPIKASFKPFQRWKLSAGVGPAIHFRRKLYSLDLDRDTELNEPYVQIQKSHRPFTFNYEMAIEYLLTNRLSVIINQSGSIGEITRSFKSYGNTYKLPLKWKSIGFTIAYRTLEK